jgi:hypothetical protein
MAPISEHMPLTFERLLAKSVWEGLSKASDEHAQSVYDAIMAQRSSIWETMEADGATRLGPVTSGARLLTTVERVASNPPRYNVRIGTSYSVVLFRERYDFRAPIDVEVTCDGGAFMAHVRGQGPYREAGEAPEVQSTE